MIDYRLCVDLAEEVYRRHQLGTLDICIGSARIALIHRPEALYIGVAGTDDGETVRTDLRFIPSWSPELGCHLHLGMKEATYAAWPALLRAIQALPSGAPIVLVGHSLGGGLALIIGALLVMTGRLPTAIVTFGAPRIAIGGALAVLLARAGVLVTQFRRGADIIPMLPPAFLAWDWRHCVSVLAEIGTPDRPDTDHHLAGYQADVYAWADAQQDAIARRTAIETAAAVGMVGPVIL